MLALPKPPSVPPPNPSKIKSIASRYVGILGTKKKFSPLKALSTLFSIYTIGSTAYSALSSTGSELQYL